ncbi:transactivating tegument protein VP16 [Saimiriine alphaherpesvirus 1]|uniref:Alpha trans-inducing protein n=1 Tax=Saimiriine herpesvirus 1 (strain MV-5-4-PSL) TaxID=10353 RepID=E2IUC2_SHV1|nr:transactivating tegument protein VP16 [Saimiriine alphaherpesvirus 1]ADO13780.1 transactivating tegument protein VP16 [Saimiriine alphaherpesvirus 1]
MDQVMEEFFSKPIGPNGSSGDFDFRDHLDFDESLLPPPPNTARLSQPLVVPPPPMPAPPATLFARLLEDLGFSDGPALLTMLDSWNEDLFSCLPHNADIYADNPFLSTMPSDVIAYGDAYDADAGPIDLRAHGTAPLPPLPATAEGLSAYHQAVMRFFRTELRAREQQYARMLDNFCSALYRYLRASVRHRQRRVLSGSQRKSMREQLSSAITDRYYRETARIARVIYLHMYLMLIREVSWALYAEQVLRQDLFRRLSYDLPQPRQLACLFHPFLFQHGSFTVGGKPVAPDRLRTVNYIRERLSLPQIRSASVEEPSEALTQPPVLRGDRARSSGYFMTLVRHKLDAYCSMHMSESERVQREHSYTRGSSRRANYGSSIEGMLAAPSDDVEEDYEPPPPPRISLTPSGGTTAAALAPSGIAEAPEAAATEAPPMDDEDLDFDMEFDADSDLGDEAMRAIDDFDLALLGPRTDSNLGGPLSALRRDDLARYAARGFEMLDAADLEFEQMFSESLQADA